MTDSKFQIPYLRYVRFICRNYVEIKKAVWTARNDTCTPNKNGGASSAISSPTESKAVRDLSPVPSIKLKDCTIYKPEIWLYCIGQAVDMMPTAQAKIMWAWMHGEKLSGDYTSKELTEIRRHLFIAVSVLAIERGLIKLSKNQ